MGSSAYRITIKAVEKDTAKIHIQCINTEYWEIPPEPNFVVELLVNLFWKLQQGYNYEFKQLISDEEAEAIIRTHPLKQEFEHLVDLFFGKLIPVTPIELKTIYPNANAKNAYIGNDKQFFQGYRIQGEQCFLRTRPFYEKFVELVPKWIQNISVLEEKNWPWPWAEKGISIAEANSRQQTFPFKDKDKYPQKTFQVQVTNSHFLYHLKTGVSWETAPYFCTEKYLIAAKKNRQHPFLVEAVKAENEFLVALMIRGGVDLNYPDAKDWQAVDYAIYKWNRPILLRLIEAGIDVNYVLKSKEVDFGSLLYEASKRGDLALMDILIDRGADVNYNYYDVSFLLDEVVYYEQHEAIRKLAVAGVDLDRLIEDGEGMNALMYAIKEKSIATAKVLIEVGANIHAVNPDGWTPLFFAVSEDKYELVDLLLEKGAYINHDAAKVLTVRNFEFHSPLGRAVSNKQHDMLRYLIKKGADINIMTDGSPLLFKAMDYGLFKAIDILLEAGVNVLVRDKFGQTAINVLHQIIARYQTEIWKGMQSDATEIAQKHAIEYQQERIIEKGEALLKKLIELGCPIE